MFEQLQQLTSLLFSPAGLLGSLVLGVCLMLCSHSELGRMRLLGLAVFLSSLGRFENEWEFGLPLIYGLEQLRAVGRFVAFGLVGFLCVLGYLQQQQIPRIPKAALLWLVVQLVISVKYLMAGSQVDALMQVPLALASTLAVLYALSPDKTKNSTRLRELLLVSGGLFIAANAIQWLVNRRPLFLSKGLFVGTTGNPQHAAVYLALTAVGSIYFYVNERRRELRWMFAIVGAGSLLGLVLSGSRTGAAMVVVGVCVLMLASGKKLRFTFGMGSLALVAALTLQHFFGQAKTFNLNSMQKLQSHENTREQVFRAQFASFCEYPVMGRPFQPGTRCRFGESSWLGAAGHTGLCGLVPMVMAACGVLFQWLRIRRANRSFRNEWLMPFVVAGVLMLLTGSFLEAYLLGVVTFPIFWTLAFLVTMDHCYRRLLAQRVALPLTLQSSPLLASYLQPLDR